MNCEPMPLPTNPKDGSDIKRIKDGRPFEDFDHQFVGYATEIPASMMEAQKSFVRTVRGTAFRFIVILWILDGVRIYYGQDGA
jgi:hypothetical protein